MSKYTRKLRRQFAQQVHDNTPRSDPDDMDEPATVESVSEVIGAVSHIQRALSKTSKSQSRIMTKSEQPRFSTSYNIFGSVYRWVRDADLEEPPYAADSQTRDQWLRQFVLREPHLVGVINSVCMIDGNRGWDLTGGRNQVKRFTDILHDNYFVTPDVYGWRPGIKTAAQSYYTTDMGSVVEIGRDGRNGPLRALYHVDSARCRLTGNSEEPLQYRPKLSGLQSWNNDDYFRISSYVSADEGMRGLGFCAVSRCLELAKVMVAVYLHDQEQLGARAPKGIIVLKNVSQNAWEDAMAKREEDLDEKERKFYGGLAVLAGMGPQDVDAKLIALSQLPLGFDLDKFTQLLIYGYALAVGYDSREFWPVSGGRQGTATETEAQHMKATGKGGMDFANGYQEHLQRLLPESLAFEFEQRDDKGELLTAQVAQAKAAGPLAIYAAGLQQGVPVISQDETRSLLAELSLIPEEWTVNPGDVTSTDTQDAAQNLEDQNAIDPSAQPNMQLGPQSGGGVPSNQKQLGPPAPLPTTQLRMLDSPRVRRAIDMYPDEDIVSVNWPTMKSTLIRSAGKHLWAGINRSSEDSTNPKDQRVQLILDMIENGRFISRGGATSGNFGHAGRPGEVGGSEPNKGSRTPDKGKLGLKKHDNVKINSGMYVDQAIVGLLGSDATSDDVVTMVGAPEGSIVDLHINEDENIFIIVHNPAYEGAQERLLYRDPSGTLAMSNEIFVLKDSAPPGTGTKIFAEEVFACQKAGVKFIETDAARSTAVSPGTPPLVGYYVWPRLGFDAFIPRSVKAVMTTTPFKNYDHISQLMKTQGGRDFWKKNGVGTHMHFSLATNSKSMKVLEAYLKAKNITVNRSTPLSYGQGDGLDMTPEDDRILDEIWDSIDNSTDMANGLSI